MPPAPPDDIGLYKELAGAAPKKLTNAVEKVDGVTADEEKDLERGGLLALRGTKRRIARWGLWFLFVIGALLVLLASVGLSWLVYAYISDMIDQGRTGEIITALLSFLSGVFLTLAVEFLWHIGTRGKSGGD